jgi:hypothetical protein
VTKRLQETARDLGYPATREGTGLIDAAAATAPSLSEAPKSSSR